MLGRVRKYLSISNIVVKWANKYIVVFVLYVYYIKCIFGLVSVSVYVVQSQRTVCVTTVLI